MAPIRQRSKNGPQAGPSSQKKACPEPVKGQNRDTTQLVSMKQQQAALKLQTRFRGMRAREQVHPRLLLLDSRAQLHNALAARQSKAECSIGADGLRLAHVARHSTDAVLRAVSHAQGDEARVMLKSAAILASRLHAVLEVVEQISLQRTPADVMRHVQLAALEVCSGSAAEVLLLGAGAHGKTLALGIAPTLFFPANRMPIAGQCALTGTVQLAEEGTDDGFTHLAFCELAPLAPLDTSADSAPERGGAATGSQVPPRRTPLLPKGCGFFIHSLHVKEAEERAAASGYRLDLTPARACGVTSVACVPMCAPEPVLLTGSGGEKSSEGQAHAEAPRLTAGARGKRLGAGVVASPPTDGAARPLAVLQVVLGLSPPVDQGVVGRRRRAAARAAAQQPAQPAQLAEPAEPAEPAPQQPQTEGQPQQLTQPATAGADGGTPSPADAGAAGPGAAVKRTNTNGSMRGRQAQSGAPQSGAGSTPGEGNAGQNKTSLTADDLALLQIVASHGASALAAARARTEQRARAQRAQRALSRSFKMQGSLHELRKAAAELVPCEACFLFLTGAGTPAPLETGARLGLESEGGWLTVFDPQRPPPPPGATDGLDAAMAAGVALRAREGEGGEAAAGPLSRYLDELAPPALGGERSAMCAPLFVNAALVRNSQVEGEEGGEEEPGVHGGSFEADGGAEGAEGGGGEHDADEAERDETAELEDAAEAEADELAAAALAALQSGPGAAAGAGPAARPLPSCLGSEGAAAGGETVSHEAAALAARAAARAERAAARQARREARKSTGGRGKFLLGAHSRKGSLLPRAPGRQGEGTAAGQARTDAAAEQDRQVLAGVIQWVNRRVSPNVLTGSGGNGSGDGGNGIGGGSSGFDAEDARLATAFCRTASNALALLSARGELGSLRRLVRDASRQQAATAALARALSAVTEEVTLSTVVKEQLSLAGARRAGGISGEGEEDGKKDGRAGAEGEMRVGRGGLGRGGLGSGGLGGRLGGGGGLFGSARTLPVRSASNAALGGNVGIGGSSARPAAAAPAPDDAKPCVRAESASLLILRPEERCFWARAPDGTNPPRTISSERGLLAVLARRGEAFVVRAAENDARLDVRGRIEMASVFALRSGPADAPPSARLRSLLLQPLLGREGQVIGAIALANRVADSWEGGREQADVDELGVDSAGKDAAPPADKIGPFTKVCHRPHGLHRALPPPLLRPLLAPHPVASRSVCAPAARRGPRMTERTLPNAFCQPPSARVASMAPHLFLVSRPLPLGRCRLPLTPLLLATAPVLRRTKPSSPRWRPTSPPA